MKKLFTQILVLALLHIGTSMADAQIFMEKTKISRDVEPGQTYVEDVTIFNTTEENVQVRVYWQDFVYVEPFDGKKEFKPAGTSDYTMSDWVSFSPQNFTLGPKENKKINISVRVPEPIESGGFYGVLFYERPPEDMAGQVGLKIVTRLGTLFFFETKDKDKSNEVADIVFEGNIIRGGFSNQGNVFLLPKGIYYLMDTSGLVVSRGEVKRMFIAPNKTAQFEVELDESLDTGEYTLVLTFDIKDGDSVVREVDFVKQNDSSFEIKEIRE